MITICELISNQIMPALRCYIAKKLIKKYKITQLKVSKILGLSQPSISYYSKGKRAKEINKILKSKELNKRLESLAERIVKENLAPAQIHSEICIIMKEILEKRMIKEIILPGPCLVKK